MKNKLRLILSLTATLLFTVGAAQAQVVVVSGANPPLVNGANLLAAIAGIPAPGPANPWVVKLEPGIYDLGGQQIVMRDFVDIEGSGRDVTYVQSDVTLSPSDAVVEAPAGIEAELRELTITNNSPSTGTGVRISTSAFLLTEVNIEALTGRDGIGAQTLNVSPRINEVFARVNAGSSGIGFEIIRGGTVITQSLAFVQGTEKVFSAILTNTEGTLDGLIGFAFGGEANIALYVQGQTTPDVINSRFTATGGTEAYGLLATDSQPQVKESTFFVTNNNNRAVALEANSNAAVLATESTFIARGISTAANIIGVSSSNAAVRLNQSNVDSSIVGLQAAGTGTVRMGASQLIGTVAGPLGSLRCIFTYNNLYNARAANCV